MSQQFKIQEVAKTYEFCRPYIKKFGAALDIGCDEFMFAGALEKDFKHVYCFDFRNKSSQMRSVISDSSRVTFHHTGLGEVEDIRYTKSGVGRIKADQPQGNSTLAVPIVPLDSFKLFNDIDFIKIDVEGYEPQVLRGSKKTIESSWPVILCEINRGDFAAKELLEEMGYRCVDVYHKLGKPHDYLFVKD